MPETLHGVGVGSKTEGVLGQFLVVPPPQPLQLIRKAGSQTKALPSTEGAFVIARNLLASIFL